MARAMTSIEVILGARQLHRRPDERGAEREQLQDRQRLNEAVSPP